MVDEPLFRAIVRRFLIGLERDSRLQAGAAASGEGGSDVGGCQVTGRKGLARIFGRGKEREREGEGAGK